MIALIVTASLCVLVLGVAIGIASEKCRIGRSITGTLKIDSSDPDGPYLFLELDRTVDYVKSKDCVILRVDASNYLSQK